MNRAKRGGHLQIVHLLLSKDTKGDKKKKVGTTYVHYTYVQHNCDTYYIDNVFIPKVLI